MLLCILNDIGKFSCVDKTMLFNLDLPGQFKQIGMFEPAICGVNYENELKC